MKSRLFIFGRILIVISLCVGVSFAIYGKQKSKQVRQVMKIVHQHDPKFGELDPKYPYPRHSRVMQNGDAWLVYNSWDVNHKDAVPMLDGAYYMEIQNDKVVDYQKGAVSAVLTQRFYCVVLKGDKKRYWIFDEHGNRTGCIEWPEEWH